MLSGCVFPIMVIVFLILFTMGPWALSYDTTPCLAVEHPHTNQFSEDPTSANPKLYLGLEVIDVSARFTKIAWYGLVLYIVLFIMNIVVPPGSSINTGIGYISIAWFFWLMKARYDHYGRVCSVNGLHCMP